MGAQVFSHKRSGGMAPIPSPITPLLLENALLAPAKGQERWLSGYSDASFKPEPPQAGGGWGCWVRDSNTRILRSGPCPDWVRNSQDAELCGVFSAIYTALTKLDSDWANILVIKTDNQGVARLFGWGRSKCTPRPGQQAELVEKALLLANEKRVRLIVAWVKGHRGHVDTSAYLNTRVDQMAGEARRTREPSLLVMPIQGSIPGPRA